MHLSILRPAVDLEKLVSGYCLWADPDCEFVGETICTAPQLGACLCLQLGGDVLTDFRDPTPLMSYAGVQSGIRRYRPLASARSLVIFLTPLGSIRFLPSLGGELCDEGHDIAGIVGDGEVRRLHVAATAAPDNDLLRQTVDAWLRNRFARSASRYDHHRLAEAMVRIGRPEETILSIAHRLDISERQLERSFREHLGLSPKRYQQVHRVTRSLQRTLSGQGDPMDGYSDQAHQIRNWQAYLGFTPGQLLRRGASPMGAMFREVAGAEHEGWAHYI